MIPKGAIMNLQFKKIEQRGNDMKKLLFVCLLLCAACLASCDFVNPNVTFDNIHTFSGTTHAIRVLGGAQVTGLKFNNLFFRCDQASGYMRGTATSIITDKAKYRGCPVLLEGLKGDMEFNHVLTERVSVGIQLSGGANVTVNDLSVVEYGKHLTVVDAASTLTIN